MRGFSLKNGRKNIFTVINKCGKNSPVVIMFHGFTGNHIETHFMFSRLSKVLGHFGISSIRFDFIGSGNSDGVFEDITLSSEISDAYVVANYARKHFTNIGILGFSMGGLLALLTAKKIKPNAICLWAPNTSARNRFTRNDQVASKENFPNDLLRDYIDIGGLRISNNLNEEKQKLSLEAFLEAKKYKDPVLIIHGTSDQTIPFIRSEVLVKQFKNGTLIPLKGANHTFDSFNWSEITIIETAKFFYEVFTNKKSKGEFSNPINLLTF